jgi:hypothetical protein
LDIARFLNLSFLASTIPAFPGVAGGGAPAWGLL